MYALLKIEGVFIENLGCVHSHTVCRSTKPMHSVLYELIISYLMVLIVQAIF